MFRRVLIANRGEVAVRVIRACRELGIETVAVYSTADRDSLHVRLADRAVQIGPPPARAQLPEHPFARRRSHDDWLRAPSTRAGASSPRTPSSPRACEDNDLVFVGPTARDRSRHGRQGAARSRRCAAAGLPLVPGSDGAATLDEAKSLAGGRRLPAPSEGVGGRRRQGHAPRGSLEELEGSFRTAAAEAEAAFGDGGLYVERALVDARHVEIQVLGDGDGRVLTLGERDCSIQRRHQKLVEEAPSPAVSPELRAAMEDAARRACEALRYRGAGTLEFLLDATEASTSSR